MPDGLSEANPDDYATLVRYRCIKPDTRYDRFHCPLINQTCSDDRAFCVLREALYA